MIDTQTWLVLGTIVVAAIAIALYTRQLVRSTTHDIWRAIETAATESANEAALIRPALRKVQPISSKVKLLPMQVTTLKTTLRQNFRPERVFISDHGGTERLPGSAQWIVDDIRVDGQTQFSQKGSVPGDMFSARSIDSFVSFDTGSKEIEMDVIYIGTNQDGMVFHGSIIGALPVDHTPPETALQPNITVSNSGGRPTLLASHVTPS